MDIKQLTHDAIDLLKKMISTPSFSMEEAQTALLLENWFIKRNIPYKRHHNNIWAIQKDTSSNKPVLLLNSHHDTVRPNQGYTKNPLSPIMENEKLYGLGSNDAGGCLVSLLTVFTYFYHSDSLPYRLAFIGSAEEEINGKNGISSVLPYLPPLAAAIVGEPTQMNMAIAERGLMVVDIQVKGTPSHAAHQNHDNPILKCGELFEKISTIVFDKVSPLLGEIKLTLTQIEGGAQHNVVPDRVNLVLDVRVNECYRLEEVLKILKQQLNFVSIQERSLRLQPSMIDQSHPLVEAAKKLKLATYGSSTLSDQAFLSCPSVKIGPGDTLRSHTADEFIYLYEIENGIQEYINLLNTLTL